jgi:hypothetical protein
MLSGLRARYRPRAIKTWPDVHAKNGRPKGLKAHLPVKPCLACGRPMSWRKAWARTWADVKYCSERCRRAPGRPHV